MIEEEKKADILKMSEVDSYFLIDECGAFIWRMNHDMAHGRIEKEYHAAIQEDIMNVREVQKFAVDNLIRFSVDPESAKDREHGDYWKWYNFWDKWKKGLSDENWETLMQRIANHEPYDEYLPKGTWRD
jgi:hypothetical protein